MMDPKQRKLDVEQHVKYWKRCLRTLLPTGYTSNDSSRMALGFFIMSALDLLGASDSLLDSKQCAEIRDWILACQHPNGGFCGSPNHRYPDAYYVDVGRGTPLMDPANLPATFFAILALSFVGNLNQIKRTQCLKWLRSLQRDDGSFGELITEDGSIHGGRDMRYCYVAAAVRWMLTENSPQRSSMKEDDIDILKLVEHLKSGQTYDGGISESATHEAHAGYTYCAVAALSLIDRDITPSSAPITSTPNALTTQPYDILDLHGIIRWLVFRQVVYETDDPEDDSEYPYISDQNQGNSHRSGVPITENVENQTTIAVAAISLEDERDAGFNGRCNKPVDTCYAFWVTASLNMLCKDKNHIFDSESSRRFLLDYTQHIIGGFGKTPGDPPDIYHSYLGLAALAINNEPGLKVLDPALCISGEQRAKIEKMKHDSLVPTRTYWKHGYAFLIREDNPDAEQKLASSEGPPQALVDALEAL